MSDATPSSSPVSGMHSPATRDGTPGLLDADQRARFWREGYLVAGEAVSDAQLSALRRAFDRWVAESAAHVEVGQG